MKVYTGDLETLTGTPYRQQLFHRNGVPGRSGLLSPLFATPLYVPQNIV